MSIEGILLSCQGDIPYYKESIHIREDGNCHILYKFFLEIKKPCDIHIFVPYRIERLIWKQENIKNKEYVEKQAGARGLQKLEKDIFLYNIQDVEKFEAYIPENNWIEKVTEIRGFKSICIKLSQTDLPKKFFEEKSCKIGLMFKITTLNFLSNKTIKKLIQSNQFWDFNVFIYPLTTSLPKEKTEKFALIKFAEIWVVLPENTTPIHIHPPNKDIMKIEREEEERAVKFTEKGKKLLKEGKIAIKWEFTDIKTEKSIFFTGRTQKFQFDEIKNDLKKEIEEEIKKSISKDIEKIAKKIFKENAITWKQMFVVLTAILSIFGLLIGMLLK